MTTATEIQQGTRRTISGTVQNPREDGHGHYLIDLQGTGWTQDKYAVTAFQVGGSETLAALPVGRHIEVVVEAQQKREGKDGCRCYGLKYSVVSDKRARFAGYWISPQGETHLVAPESHPDDARLFKSLF